MNILSNMTRCIILCLNRDVREHNGEIGEIQYPLPTPTITITQFLALSDFPYYVGMSNSSSYLYFSSTGFIVLENKRVSFLVSNSK